MSFNQISIASFVLLVCCFSGCSSESDFEKSYSYIEYIGDEPDFYHRKFYNDTSFWEFRVLNGVVIDSTNFIIKPNGWYRLREDVLIPFFTDSMFDDPRSKQQNKSFYSRPLRRIIVDGENYYLCQHVDNLSFIIDISDTVFHYFHLDSGFVKQTWEGALKIEEKRLIILNKKIDISIYPRAPKRDKGIY